MNLLADRLFALMLGWTKTLFNSLWNVLTNDTGSFAGILQRLWMPLIILILVFGTLADYVIWLVRWRPYYVWSAWLRKRMVRRRLNRTQSYMEDLDHSPLDLPEYQDIDTGSQSLIDEPVYFDFQAFGQPEPEEQSTIYHDKADPPPHFVPMLPWENVRQVPVLSEEQFYQTTMNQETAAPWMQANVATSLQQDTPVPESNTNIQVQSPISVDNVSSGNNMLRRRRRVDSKHQRGGRVLQSLVETFFTTDENRETVDSLQPPITQEEAFHKPYYPQNYVYREQKNPQAEQDKQ